MSITTRHLISPLCAAAAILLAAAASASASAADVPPTRLPPSGTAEIAQYGGHLAWVDTLPDGAPVVLDRAHGRTVALRIAPPVSDLDLGPGRDGRPVAVYARCARSCDVFRYDIARGREQRVAGASAPGVDERLPSVWGSRIAFAREGDVVVRDEARRSRRIVARRADPDDLELGPKHLAWAALEEQGEGEAVVLRLRGLASGRERALAVGFIGEATATGFGALTFDATTLHWQSRRRVGCRVLAPAFAHYDVRRDRRARAVPAAAAPPAVALKALVPPPTPESEDC
jgi:hypothetical protein